MSKASRKINIAIDGYSSCGKSTLAKALASRLDYIFIDSGAMYRGVCWYALQNGLIVNNAVDTFALTEELPFIDLTFSASKNNKERSLLVNGHDVSGEIRTLEISRFVSPVSAIREVRLKLVEQQQLMGKNGGVVMDGRDIGTVVFPDAELKLFVTASLEIRGQRRFLEMQQKGESVTLQEVIDNLVDRDRIDSTRTESPLRQAQDAIVIDNSFLTPEEQLHKALLMAEKLINP